MFNIEEIKKIKIKVIKSIDTKDLPVKDLVVSGLIIFIMSTMIANIYDPLLGFSYALGNVLTLAFLSWLYQDSWSKTK